jgi:hypothetical protein
VRRTIQCTLSDFGVTDQPPGGCSLPPIDRGSVERIVQEVMRGLRPT